MDPAAAARSPTVALDSAGHVAGDVACRTCDYNLRGLPPDDRCPECGTAVGWSIHGDRLFIISFAAMIVVPRVAFRAAPLVWRWWIALPSFPAFVVHLRDWRVTLVLGKLGGGAGRRSNGKCRFRNAGRRLVILLPERPRRRL